MLVGSQHFPTCPGISASHLLKHVRQKMGITKGMHHLLS